MGKYIKLVSYIVENIPVLVQMWDRNPSLYACGNGVNDMGSW